MKAVLTRALAPLDAVCIESPRTGLGIPDVNFIGGWIECKSLAAWPKHANELPVKFHHPLTKEQGVWLYRRSRAGGLAMVCAKVSTSWFFFDGLWIKDRWAQMTRPEMIKSAELYMPRKMEADLLRRFIAVRLESLRQQKS